MKRAVDYAGLAAQCETEDQRKLIDTLSLGISQGEAATMLGIGPRSVAAMLKRIRANAAGTGTRHITGTSTLLGPDGEVRLKWVKEAADTATARLDAMRLAVQMAAEQFKGRARPIAPPKGQVSDDLMLTVPIGDPHIGMYAWQEECGEDFDVEIARADLVAAMGRVLGAAPKTKRCVVANLGDFFHSDNNQGLTARSGASLDVDTRWARVLRVGWQLMIDVITMALQRHERVEVINCIGNHDDHTSQALAAIMEAWFHAEPRVKVHPAPSKFHYVEHGKVLLGFTHGDTCKPTLLGGVMAADKAEAWGRTLYRHWLTGHVHHTAKHEFHGGTQESFRTLAAKDAWHTAAGYRSGRDLNGIVYHAEYGEVERYRCDIRLARAPT